MWGKTQRSDVPVFKEVDLIHNSLNVMTGNVNVATLHMLPMAKSEGKAEELRFSITGRAAKRLLVNLVRREYQIYKQGGAWETHALPEPTSEESGKRSRKDGRSGPAKRSKVTGASSESRDAPVYPRA